MGAFGRTSAVTVEDRSRSACRPPPLAPDAERGNSGCAGFRLAALQAALESATGPHRVGPLLPQSTAEIINAVAGHLPLSAQRPARPVILA